MSYTFRHFRQRFKDGAEIGTNASNIKTKKEGSTHSLTVEKSVLSDQGVYEAKITNSLGEASSKCMLNVDGK